MARELGIHRQTVGKYVAEMSEKYRKQREEKGYHDLEVLLQALDQVEADCWSKKARMDRALEDEDERRKLINEMRAAEGKEPIADADVALMKYWPKYHAQLSKEIREAEEVRGKALGIITNRDRTDQDAEAKLAELERLMSTPITIRLVHAPPPDPSWLTAEERKALELSKDEYSVIEEPVIEESDDTALFTLD
jgi:FMN phosphatase YigB (HAD superfamily)